MTANPPRNAPSPAPCHVWDKTFARTALHPWLSVRPGLSALIDAEQPHWSDGRFICQTDPARFRRRYVERMLEDERAELTTPDKSVLDSLEAGTLLSRQWGQGPDDRSTLRERMADRVARFGGSGPFIVIFPVVLTLWIGTNVAGLLGAPFDPSHFILLNLLLSCIAAVQAPIIMMSQRRQETMDRLRGKDDYRVNLKAELKIRQLHKKIDHQLTHQWQRLVEMQQIQFEMLEERNRR